MTSPRLTHAAGQTCPSREFLVRQACLNAMAKEAPHLAASEDLAYYARGRFDLALRRGITIGVTDIVRAVQCEFYTLASHYTQSDAIMGEGK